MIVPAYPGRVVPPEIFMSWKFGMGFLGGYIVIQGVFWVLFEALGIFVGFDFYSVEKEVPRRKMSRKKAK